MKVKLQLNVNVDRPLSGLKPFKLKRRMNTLMNMFNRVPYVMLVATEAAIL